MRAWYEGIKERRSDGVVVPGGRTSTVKPASVRRARPSGESFSGTRMRGGVSSIGEVEEESVRAIGAMMVVMLVVMLVGGLVIVVVY